MHKKMEELKSTGKPYELSVSLMKNLILQAYRIGIKEVYFVGGEPFIEENIFNLVQCASRLGMASTVNTNGLLLNADKIDRVFDCGLSCLTFSIDGPDKETYESIRGEHIFEQVVGNLENLLSRRAEKGSLKPRITILCTVMRQNIQKLPQMVVFAKKIGVDWVQFQPVVPDNTDQSQDVFSDTWIGEENFNTLDSSINDVIRLKKGEFSSFITSSFQQLELTKLYFRNQMPRVRSCYLGLSRLIVTQDHKLYFCAQDPLTGNVSFGDVSQKPLKELWTSKEAGRFREHIKHCNRPCLLFCAYRHEFDSLWDRFKKFNVHIDRMLGKNPSNG
ncbi:MAG: radical SAM protein [Candidatus Omnitrophica bacterium]|nr:radical SAM protein [Candidatus Omnitrophota bacterium]